MAKRMTLSGLNIRAMTEADLALGMRLKTQAGWNQTEADWRRFFRMSPEGCFVAEVRGLGVATVLVLEFGSVAWIAMMLVDEAWRGKGIGTRMMQHALDWCGTRRATAVRLDATPMGRPVYEKLGFVYQYTLTRFQGNLSPVEPLGKNETPSLPIDLDELAGLDNAMPGTDRRALLAALLQDNPTAFHVVPGAGFGASRPGTRATQIGPVIARDRETGVRLLDRLAHRCADKQVFVDIPDANPATAWARAQKLEPQRVLYRMMRGTAPDDRIERIFASAGPEKG